MNPKLLHSAAISVLLLVISVMSCEKSGKTIGNDVISEINSFFIDAQKGTSTTFIFESNCRWEIKTDAEWLEFSPSSGNSGTNTVTVTAISDNNSGTEREAEVSVCSEDMKSDFYIFQKNIPSLKSEYNNIECGFCTDTLYITIYSNTCIKYSSDSEWIRIEEAWSEPGAILSDGKTRSEFTKNTFKCIYSSNSSSTERRSTLTFSTEDATSSSTIYATQIKAPFPDWTEDFNKQSVAVCFTATWCGFCPEMKSALDMAMSRMSQTILPVNIHPLSSNPLLAWDGTQAHEKMYNANGYPFLTIDRIAHIPLQSSTSKTATVIKNIVEESEKSYYPNTTLGIYSSICKDSIDVDICISGKLPGKYRLFVYLLEDGIVAKQTSASDETVHDNIVRQCISGADGIEIDITGKQVSKMISISNKLPENILSNTRCKVIAFTSVKGECLSKEVTQANYMDYGDYIDNAAISTIENKNNL